MDTSLELGHPSDVINRENLWFRPLTHEGYVGLADQVLNGNQDIVTFIVERCRRGGIMGVEKTVDEESSCSSPLSSPFMTDPKVKGKVRFLVGQMMRSGQEGTVDASVAERVLIDDVLSKRMNADG